MKPLGKSEVAIFAWLKDHPGSKSQAVGDALYDSTSSCATGKYAETITTAKHVLRGAWASKVLQRLKKRGLVRVSNYNNPIWFIVGEYSDCPSHRDVPFENNTLCSCQSTVTHSCHCHLIRAEGKCPRGYK